MKTKIQKLIEEQKQKIIRLLTEQNIAAKLNHNAHCVVITAQLKEIHNFIEELENLIHDGKN